MEITPKGAEPANIKKRIDTLFAKLDNAYPDKVIRSLQRDHKHWAETVKELYRLLGYPDGNSFLEAYGYTVQRGEAGRPKTNNYCSNHTSGFSESSWKTCIFPFCKGTSLPGSNDKHPFKMLP